MHSQVNTQTQREDIDVTCAQGAEAGDCPVPEYDG